VQRLLRGACVMGAVLILIVIGLTIAAMFVVPWYARELARKDDEQREPR
jgi:hypothetical protein